MHRRGYGWLPLLAGLSVAAMLSLSWYSLWQQQQRLQRVYHWRLSLLQLQQAQRQFYGDSQRFASSEQELVSAGLLPASLAWPYDTQWQFTESAETLTMRTELNQAPVALLMKDFNSYLWQAPWLTVKVVGYAAN